MGAFGRSSCALVDAWVAIAGDRLDRADCGDHIIVNVAERLDHVRPFRSWRDFERLAAALLPRSRGAKQLPGRNDSRDLVSREIVVELLDLARPPRSREIPGAVSRLVLADGNIGRGRIQNRGLHRWRR